MSAPSRVWHPFTQHGLEEPIPVVNRALGAVLHTADGRRIIDAISSWWVTTHGHCHPGIVAAIREQAQQMDQIIFAGWTHQPAEDLARRLVELAPRPLDHVFYSDSGSTSVEVALKMALGFWANRGEPRHRIIVMQHSYHGDTFGGMSVGERGVFNRPYQALLFDVTTVPFPAADTQQQTLDALEQACAVGDAAAFIAEPLILGAGGMLVYPPHVLAQMHAICARHGVLFIADEVMTGWGRTGTLFACEKAGVVPDLMCLSKGLTGGAVPLAVTLATPKIYDAHFSQDRSKQFFHSSSYTANPIGCAAALANLDIWRDEPVLERIATLARRQAEGLASLANVPGLINSRQCGTMIAADFACGEDAGYLAGIAPQLKAFFHERGLLLRPLGNSVYVMPPYCISAADLATVHEVIAEAAARFASL
jgi:adenosylmethionine-8-amino-7-oxononanoate aminotransferase